MGLRTIIWLVIFDGCIHAQELVWQQSAPYPSSPTSVAGVNFLLKDAIGDVNGDAITDLLVWDQLAPNGSVLNAGYVAVLSGASGVTLHGSYGPGPGESYQAVGAVGDMTGDAVGDYITYTASLGLRVHSGATGNALSTLGGVANDVTGVGDVNGDGFGDFAWGNAGSSPGPVPGAGYVTVYLGPMGTITSFQAYGLHLFDAFGWSMSPLGDVNADAIPDFLVGAPGVPLLKFVNVPGWAYVVSGADGSFIHQFTGPTSVAKPHFGQVVAGIGDIDLDGLPDILVGAPDVPAVYVYSGGSGALLATLQVPYQSPNSFGRHLRGLSDVDGDGVPDFAIRGQWGTGSIPSQISAPTLIYSGATFNILYSVDNLLPEPPYYAYGWTFDRADDMNGDGFQEIVISAITFTLGQPSKIVMVSLEPSGMSTFGSGCPSDVGSIPRVGVHPAAVPGGSINFHVSESSVGRCAGLALGLSNTGYGSLTLPWFPFPVSGPLCALRVSLDDFVAPIPTHLASNNKGAASHTLAIPNVPGLSGLSFYGQWAVENAAGSWPPIATSRGLQITIQ
jgi:hypothetical protein